MRILAVLVLALGGACSEPSGRANEPPAPTAPPSPPGEAPAGPAADAPSDVGPGPADAAPEPLPVDAGPPDVQRIGRFDERDPRGPICGWPGCRIVARFEGTVVRVRLSERPVNHGPSEWDVAIDGAWKTPHLVLEPGEHEYVLAEGLPRGVHTVELYKRSEAQNGVTQFLGYEFPGGALLPPPPRRDRRVEIVGDSDVTGFGYVGALTGVCEPGPMWAARFENFRGAWGARLGEKLAAELHGTAFSGKGFYYNIWRPDPETVDRIFPLANPVDKGALWDTATWIPHVVVVAIGGNDYNIGQPQDFGAAPLEGFTRKAGELTATLREAYPEAHIFLMAYAVLTDEFPPGRGRRSNVEAGLKAVRDARLAQGDARVYFTAPPPSVPEELTACDGHGGPEYHERIAAFLESEIRARTGW